MRVLIMYVFDRRFQPRDIFLEVDSSGSCSSSWCKSSSLRVQCDGIPSVGDGSCTVPKHFSRRVLQVPDHSDSHEEGGISHGFVAILHDSVFDRRRCDHNVWNCSISADSHSNAIEVGLSVVSYCRVCLLN